MANRANFSKRFLAGLSSAYLHIAVGVGIQLVLIPLLLDRVGVQATGVYLLLMTTSQFVAVGIGWLAGAAVKLIAEADVQGGNVSTREVHHIVFLGFLCYGVLVFVVAVAASFLVGPVWLSDASSEFQAQVRLAIVVLGAYVGVNYVHQADLSLFIARLEQGTANLYRVLSLSLYAAIAFPLVLWQPRVDSLMLAQMAAAGTCAIVARLQLRTRGMLGPMIWSRPKPELMRRMTIDIGGPFFVFGIAQFVLMYADALIIAAMLGAEAVAIYSVLCKIPDFLALIASRISDTLSPYFTRLDATGERGKLRLAYLATSRLQHLLAVTGAIGYCTLGPWIVGVWVGVAHRPHDWTLYVLASVGLLFQIVNRHDVVLHFATARVGRLVLPHFIEVGGKLALTAALIPSLGIAAPLVAYAVIEAGGMTWWYRRAGLSLVDAGWAEWLSKVAAAAAPLAVLGTLMAAALSEGSMNWDVREAVLIGIPVLATAVIYTVWSVASTPQLRATLTRQT